MTRLTMLFVMPLLFSTFARAELDKASQEALDKTMRLLTDPVQRQQAINASPDAAKADQKAKALGGPENTQKVYELSALILSDLVQQANGDPAALNNLIIKAQTNPQGFYESLSPNVKAQILELTRKLQSPPAPKPK